MKNITPLAVLFSLSTFGAATASEYYVVVPMPNRVAVAQPSGGASTLPGGATQPNGEPTPPEPPAPVITVSLSSYSLPSAIVGKPYVGFDFNSVLQVLGDEAYLGNGVTFSISSGSLPSGLSLDASSGLLSGTAQIEESTSFGLTATYKTKSAAQSYTLQALFARIVNVAGVRQWSDGSYASSCLDYMTGAPTKKYEGDVGSGVYRVQPAGMAPTDAYCDMTSDGGGWTLVLKGVGKTSSMDQWAAATGSLNATNLLSADYSGESAKHSDAFINALKKSGSVYKLEGQSSAFGVPVRYAPGSCVYNHAPVAVSVFSAQRPNCDRTYADANLSSGQRIFSAANTGGNFGGINDSAYTSATMTYTTSYYASGTGIYYTVGNGGTYYYHRNDGSYRAGSSTFQYGAGANLRMWVR